MDIIIVLGTHTIGKISNSPNASPVRPAEAPSDKFLDKILIILKEISRPVPEPAMAENINLVTIVATRDFS